MRVWLSPFYEHDIWTAFKISHLDGIQHILLLSDARSPCDWHGHNSSRVLICHLHVSLQDKTCLNLLPVASLVCIFTTENFNHKSRSTYLQMFFNKALAGLFFHTYGFSKSTGLWWSLVYQFIGCFGVVWCCFGWFGLVVFLFVGWFGFLQAGFSLISPKLDPCKVMYSFQVYSIHKPMTQVWFIFTQWKDLKIIWGKVLFFIVWCFFFFFIWIVSHFHIVSVNFTSFVENPIFLHWTPSVFSSETNNPHIPAKPLPASCSFI